MQITKEWLQEEISRFENQRQHAHEVAIASQAAVDVLKALVERIDMAEKPESLPIQVEG
jgi:response regulator of citrate/malate metabolism